MKQKFDLLSLNDATPYINVDLVNDKVNYIVNGVGERRKALSYLKNNYPAGSVLGITNENKTIEVWILEWNYIANPNNSKQYIIGGRAVGTEDKTAYLIKPVKTE